MEKCGLLYQKKKYQDNENELVSSNNMAINEGMIDFLAEQITGIKAHGYNKEKSIYKVLDLIIGKDTFIKKAFIEQVNTEQNPLDIFREQFIAQYGEVVGNELNENFKKISELSDLLLILELKEKSYGVNENGKYQVEREIRNILFSMVNRVLFIQDDLNKKIDMMIDLEKMCDGQDTNLYSVRELLSDVVLIELLKDDSIDYNQKLDMIKKIREQGISISDETIDIAFFSMEEIQKLSIDQKLEIYIHFKKGEHLTKYRFNKIYQMYVKSGKIVESGYPKKELVETVLQELKNENIDTVEKIDNILNTARYYRLGKYYALPIGNNPINTVIFDEEGKMIEGEEIYYYPTRDEEIDNKSNIELLSRHFSEDNVELITEQLKENFKQYQTAYKGECKDCGVTIIGNIIRLNYEYYDKKDETSHLQVDFYSVDDNGNLQLIPKRRKVQNYR